MFAGEAFAQLAFTEVGGAFFFDGIAETTTLTNTQASQALFAGLNAESLAYSDQDVGQFNFVGTDANNYSVAITTPPPLLLQQT